MSGRSVAILAFDGMEVLDYAGPYEVFNVAGEVSDPAGAFSVCSVAVEAGAAVGRGGFTVVADWTIHDCPPPDVLVIPGGAGTRPLLRHEALIDWLRERAAEVELLMSVCTGSLLLAKAGLLRHRPATTHHGAFDLLARLDETCLVDRGPRFVRSSERIWTSAGVSAGVDLALRVVEELAGPAVKDATIEEMEWMWRS